MSHNAEKWRKLLSDFQDAYAQSGTVVFALYAVTFEERGLSRSSREPWAQLGQVLGCLPLDAEDENGYVIVVLRPGEGPSPAAEEQRRLIAQGYPIDVASEAALKRFEEVAALAGAALPRSIRDSIPFEPVGALSWWLATMWWSNPQLQIEVQKQEIEKDREIEVDGWRYQKMGYRLVWFDPFRESIDTIERCNLVSENPSLRCGEGVAETSSSTARHSGNEPPNQSDVDPIEDALSGQQLRIYRFLKQRSRSVSFDSLAELKECWRDDPPSPDAIEKGLKRLQAALNQIDRCPVALVIEAKNRRVRLDKQRDNARDKERDSVVP